MDELIKQIKNKTGNSDDIVVRNLTINNNEIYVIFSEVLCNGQNINDFIIRNISRLSPYTKDFYSLIFNSVSGTNLKEVSKLTDAIDYIFKGFCLILVDNKFIAVEMRASIDRGVPTTDSEVSIVGPKDAFNKT